MDSDKVQKMVLQELASFCKVNLSDLGEALEEALQGCYIRREKRKRSGKIRITHEPYEKLKEVQSKLLKAFYGMPVDENMFGCRPEGSPKKNARHHAKTQGKYPRYFCPYWTIKLDIENAFPSVRAETLKSIFTWMFVGKIQQGESEEEKRAVLEKLVTTLISLVTLNSRLPQGAPTSPYLFNLALIHTGVIYRVQKVCGKNRRYSFYVDDLTVTSTKKKMRGYQKAQSLVKRLERAIEEGGWFKVNQEKTRITCQKACSPHITGISFRHNGEGFTIPQTRQKEYRAKIHYVTSCLKDGRMPTKEEDGITVVSVLGILGWIHQVCGDRIPSALKKPIQEFWRVYYGNLEGWG